MIYKDLLESQKTYYENFQTNEVFFERAIFLGWLCDIGTCKFCYMSTQPKKEKSDISKLKFKGARHKVSVYIEAILTRVMNYKVEFVSCGANVFDDDYLIEILENIYKITGEKVILNIGPLTKEQLIKFQPYISGVSASIETFSKKHDDICPNKPISLYEEMILYSKELKLNRAITIILGLGETLDDFNAMKDYVEKYDINQITFYSLNPEKNTMYENSLGPSSMYYTKWISKTRLEFPNIKIIVGSWANRNREMSFLIEAGANNFTKFPAFKLFNKNEAKLYKQEINETSRKLMSYFDFEDISFEEIKKKSINLAKENFKGEMLEKILEKLNSYLEMIKKNE
ncbi:MAG: radical SAM protein [Candidatus Nanoarchaeia archaeon]|nr:radical SAM protein [Candidatus Nanoarchaeia archaeon]